MSEYTVHSVALGGEYTHTPFQQDVVRTVDLLDAVKRAQSDYDLCNEGVNDFLSWFGLSLEREYEVRINVGTLSLTVRTTDDMAEEFDDSNFDYLVNDALIKTLVDAGHDGDSFEIDRGCSSSVTWEVR